MIPVRRKQNCLRSECGFGSVDSPNDIATLNLPELDRKMAVDVNGQGYGMKNRPVCHLQQLLQGLAGRGKQLGYCLLRETGGKFQLVLAGRVLQLKLLATP